MRRRDVLGLVVVALATAALIVYRQVYLEPREWGGLCVSAAPPLACVPRSGLIWLQHYYLLGGMSLALGLLGLAWWGGFWVQLAAVVIGVAGVENYNATWGAIGAALGAWGWLRREGWPVRPRPTLPRPTPPAQTAHLRRRSRSVSPRRDRG